jgi:hypothetical protein
MSVIKCIRGKVATGKLTDAQAQEIETKIREYEQKNRRGMNEEQAKALAAQQAMDSFTKQKATKARQTKLRLARQAELLMSKEQYRGDGYRWILSEMDIDPWARNSTPPVSNLQEIHRNRAFAMMNDLLTTYRPRLAGLRRPRAGMEDVVRELHGQNTGLETAKELAEGFRQAAKYVWTEFNRASGDTIPWRDDWAMPHIHDPVRIGSVTADQWADEIIPLLNRDRMIDFDSGQPLSDVELRRMLLDMHENIRTHGMTDKTPGAPGGRAVGNRRSDPRILQFKDGDGWTAYSQKFGTGDPLDTMIGYISSMSRDIGLMDKFGPNPKAMVQTLKDTVAIDGAKKPAPGNLKGYAKSQYQKTLAGQVDATYAQLTGSSSIPENDFFAGVMSAARSIVSAGLLQSSTLSAVTDLNGQRIAYRLMGIPSVQATLKSLPNLVRNLRNALPDQQQLALHIGAGADSWTQVATGAARYTGDVSGPEWSRRMVDFTMRSILLTPWTQGGKNVIALDFYHLLHQNAGKAFAKLPTELQAEMSRFGIGEDYWNVIRKAEPHTASSGAKYVNPLNVVGADEKLGREAATRLQNMMLTLQRTGIIETSQRVKAAAVGQSQPGTLGGETRRSIALFKSFPLTQMHMQLFNAVQSRQGIKNKAGMAAGVVIGATVFGAVSTQMKEKANGRDPLSMDPTTPEGGKFWGKAMVQGGGMSIMGDFMFSDVNQYGKGPIMSLGGPMVDLMDDTIQLTYGNVQQAVKGEDTDIAKESLDMLKKYAPGGKQWYLKLAFERTVLDQLDMMADPKAHKRFQTQEKKYWKERKQRYWWKKGKTSPERAPDLGAATGQ